MVHPQRAFYRRGYATAQYTGGGRYNIVFLTDRTGTRFLGRILHCAHDAYKAVRYSGSRLFLLLAPQDAFGVVDVILGRSSFCRTYGYKFARLRGVAICGMDRRYRV